MAFLEARHPGLCRVEFDWENDVLWMMAGLWRRLRRHVVEAFARRQKLRLADGRDRRDGRQGGRLHPLPRQGQRRPVRGRVHRQGSASVPLWTESFVINVSTIVTAVSF